MLVTFIAISLKGKNFAQFLNDFCKSIRSLNWSISFVYPCAYFWGSQPRYEEE